jgi:hypothetical protein
MKELDHKDDLELPVPIKDELQSYNVLKNDKYKRFKRLKEVLDDNKRQNQFKVVQQAANKMA